jgi:hypothetical protein
MNLHALPTALAPFWFDEMELVGKVMSFHLEGVDAKLEDERSGGTVHITALKRCWVDCPKLGAREAIHSGILTRFA